jgi:hypothetical protein
MRTTIVLDPDTEASVRQLMRERGLTLTQAINEAIRQGTADRQRSSAFRTGTYPMGRSIVSIDGALGLTAHLEDEEVIRKLAQRK